MEPIKSTRSKPVFQIVKMGGFGDLVMLTAFFQPIIDLGYRVQLVTTTAYAPVLQESFWNNHPDVEIKAFPEKHFWQMRSVTPSDRCALPTYPAWWQKEFTPKHEGHILERWRLEILPEYMGELKPKISKFKAKRSPRITIQTTTGWSPYKNWPDTYWLRLKAMLEHAYPNYEIHNIGENKNFYSTIADITYSSLFIGLDSVGQHIAAAVGTPSIIIWGSTSPEMFGYSQNENLVTPGLHCNPCFREYAQVETDDDCPQEYRGLCTAMIEPEIVLEHVRHILG